MTFHEVRFPTDIAYGSSGGPVYSTDIVELASGYEQRNANWSEARAKYDVAGGIKNQDQLNEIIAFFRARKGKVYGFRFKDSSDYNVTGQVIGTGNATQTTFQLVKTYISGSVTETRTIKKPVAATLNVYLANILQTSGFAIDETTGVITFTAAPGNAVQVSADFEFDVPVRFDTDSISSSLRDINTLSVSSIPIVEIKI